MNHLFMMIVVYALVIFWTQLSDKTKVLIHDTTSVFFVMQTSSQKTWAVVSKMPTDPDEAGGTNEEKLLFYVPRKKIVYHPQYGDKAYLIAIAKDNGTEKVQWLIDDQTISLSLDSLKSVCLGDPNACCKSLEPQTNQ